MDVLSVDQAYRHLATHLRWARRPWITFVWASGIADTHQLLDRIRAGVPDWAQKLHVLRPENPEELRTLDQKIFDDETAGGAVWVEAVRMESAKKQEEGEAPWAGAWNWLLQRLNERRERLLRHLQHGLVLAMPRQCKPKVASTAPDLWSIRALALEIDYIAEPAAAGVVTRQAEPACPPATPSPEMLRLAQDDVTELQRRWHAMNDSGPDEDPDRLVHLGRQLDRTRIHTAQLLFDSGQHEQAEQQLETVLQQHGLDLQTHADALLLSARVLEKSGDVEAAVARAREALSTWREVARSRAGDRNVVADALHWLGSILSDLGQWEDACQADEAAVVILRKLVANQPESFLPNLARSLNSLGIDFSQLGQHEDALQPAKEALRIFRELAVSQPDSYRVGLARSLNSLAILCSRLGRHEEALAAAEEALDIRRLLAAQRPDAFLPELARNLDNLGINFSNLGHDEEALATTKEALDIRRGLVVHSPDVFLPELARNLYNLGNRYSVLGRFEAAVAVTEEALDVLRELAAQRPEAFSHDLARSLYNLGVLCSGVNRHRQALALCKEGLEIRRNLAELRPEAFLLEMARSLNNLSFYCINLERFDEAYTSVEEALEIWRQLHPSNPVVVGPELVTSLGNKAIVLAALGRTEEAKRVRAEAGQLATETRKKSRRSTTEEQ